MMMVVGFSSAALAAESCDKNGLCAVEQDDGSILWEQRGETIQQKKIAELEVKVGEIQKAESPFSFGLSAGGYGIILPQAVGFAGGGASFLFRSLWETKTEGLSLGLRVRTGLSGGSFFNERSAIDGFYPMESAVVFNAGADFLLYPAKHFGLGLGGEYDLAVTVGRDMPFHVGFARLSFLFPIVEHVELEAYGLGGYAQVVQNRLVNNFVTDCKYYGFAGGGGVDLNIYF